MKKSPSPETVALQLRAHFERGFATVPWGRSILSGYEWLCLIREQTGLTNWKEIEALAFRVAPEFTMEWWEAWGERQRDENPAFGWGEDWK